MKYHYCVICYCEVRHPQQTTCGASECRDAWQHLSREARARHRNLATYSPSERALILSQGPTPEEIAERAVRQQFVDEVREEHLKDQQKKQNYGFMPQSIRDMLLTNAPIKQEETNGDTEPVNAPNPDPTDH